MKQANLMVVDHQKFSLNVILQVHGEDKWE